jgi:hypothetical protein
MSGLKIINLSKTVTEPTESIYGYVYKINCYDTSVIDTYVGSTINIKSRIISHRNKCKQPEPKGIYKSINDNGGLDNWFVTILEERMFTNVEELLFTERNFTNSNKEEKYLNKSICILTTEEKMNYMENWYAKNEGYMKTYLKEWKAEKLKTDPDYQKKYNKDYSKKRVTCTCGREISPFYTSKCKQTKKHLKLINLQMDEKKPLEIEV